MGRDGPPFRQAHKLARLAARLATYATDYDSQTEARATSMALREWPRRDAL